jgi:intracellular sulfur oxidation DsrE/DsrF family protein
MSLMKNLANILVLILIFVSSQSKAQNNALEKVHHVVMQLNTADTAAWTSVIGNIKNFQKIWPGKVEIEVVVHGKALNFLVADKTHLKNDIESLAQSGIVFSACENTMNKYNITKAMLLNSAKTVPSGVAELILKQEAGWGYLKAGL